VRKLKLIGTTEAIPEDPQCEEISRKGITSAVIATLTTLTQTWFDTIREEATFARGSGEFQACIW
jgi:hypothetical protein